MCIIVADLIKLKAKILLTSKFKAVIMLHFSPKSGLLQTLCLKNV